MNGHIWEEDDHDVYSIKTTLAPTLRPADFLRRLILAGLLVAIVVVGGHCCAGHPKDIPRMRRCVQPRLQCRV